MSDNNYKFDTVIIQVEFNLNPDNDKLTTHPVQKIPVSNPNKVHPSRLMEFVDDLEHASRKTRINHDDVEEAYSYTAVLPRRLLDEWYEDNVEDVDEVDEEQMENVRSEFEWICVDIYNAVSDDPVASPNELRDAEDIDIGDDPNHKTVQKDGDQDE